MVPQANYLLQTTPGGWQHVQQDPRLVPQSSEYWKLEGGYWIQYRIGAPTWAQQVSTGRVFQKVDRGWIEWKRR